MDPACNEVAAEWNAVEMPLALCTLPNRTNSNDMWKARSDCFSNTVKILFTDKSEKKTFEDHVAKCVAQKKAAHDPLADPSESEQVKDQRISSDCHFFTLFEKHKELEATAKASPGGFAVNLARSCKDEDEIAARAPHIEESGDNKYVFHALPDQPAAFKSNSQSDAGVGTNLNSDGYAKPVGD
jgi:hypothetical protein